MSAPPPHGARKERSPSRGQHTRRRPSPALPSSPAARRCPAPALFLPIKLASKHIELACV